MQQISLDLEVKIREIKKFPFGKNLDFSHVNRILNKLSVELNQLTRKIREELYE